MAGPARKPWCGLEFLKPVTGCSYDLLQFIFLVFCNLLLRTLHWLPVKAGILYKIACLCFQCIYQNSMPPYISDLLRPYCPYCFECFICMCFVFLYLHLFSTIEQFSRGKALQKCAHYYYNLALVLITFRCDVFSQIGCCVVPGTCTFCLLFRRGNY